jgi:hypothetical protein
MIVQIVAEAICGSTFHVGQGNPTQLKEFEYLIISSPTYGGFPPLRVAAFVKALPALGGGRTINQEFVESSSLVTMFLRRNQFLCHPTHQSNPLNVSFQYLTVGSR